MILSCHHSRTGGLCQDVVRSKVQNRMVLLSKCRFYREVGIWMAALPGLAQKSEENRAKICGGGGSGKRERAYSDIFRSYSARFVPQNLGWSACRRSGTSLFRRRGALSNAGRRPGRCVLGSAGCSEKGLTGHARLGKGEKMY